MELDSKIGKFLRFGLESSKKEFDRAITYYFSLPPQDRMIYAKDMLINSSPEGLKPLHTYCYTTEIPTNDDDIIEEAQLKLRTDRDAIVSGMFVCAKFKQLDCEVSDNYWDLGTIVFDKNKSYASVQMNGGDKQKLAIDDPNVAPLLEVVDGVVIDKLNENKDLRRKLGGGAIRTTLSNHLAK